MQLQKTGRLLNHAYIFLWNCWTFSCSEEIWHRSGVVIYLFCFLCVHVCFLALVALTVFPVALLRQLPLCFADRCLGGVLFLLYSIKFNRVSQRSQNHFLFCPPHHPSHRLSCSGWWWMSSDLTLTSEWAPAAIQQVMDLITVRCLFVSTKQGKYSFVSIITCRTEIAGGQSHQ